MENCSLKLFQIAPLSSLLFRFLVRASSKEKNSREISRAASFFNLRIRRPLIENKLILQNEEKKHRENRRWRHSVTGVCSLDNLLFLFCYSSWPSYFPCCLFRFVAIIFFFLFFSTKTRLMKHQKDKDKETRTVWPFYSANLSYRYNVICLVRYKGEF